jgi:hypothetical protein
MLGTTNPPFRRPRALSFLVGCIAVAAAACGSSSTQPKIDSFAPAALRPGNSSILLVSGSGFADGAKLTLGGKTAAVRSVWVNAMSVSAVLPEAIPPGEYSVEVTNPNGRQGVSQQHLRILPAPTASPVPTQTPTASPERRTPTPRPTAPPPPPPPPPRRTVTPAPTPTETATPLPPEPSASPSVLIPPPFPPGVATVSPR